MDCNLYQSLGQVSSDQAGIIFRDFLRGSVREMICEVIAAEVEDLCGPKHSPTGGDTFHEPFPFGSGSALRPKSDTTARTNSEIFVGR